MRFARRPRAAEPSGDAGRLLVAARGGDGVALAALRADLDPGTVAVLAGLLGRVAEEPVAVLAAARAGAEDPELLEQVVLVLSDTGGRSPALVAELLDLPVADVLAARERVLSRSGLTADPPGCRGWALVGGGAGLTEAEQAAAASHLERCRRCTAARAAAAQAARRAAVPLPRPGGPARRGPAL